MAWGIEKLPVPAARFSPYLEPECLKTQRFAQFCATDAKSLDHVKGLAPCFALNVLCASRYALTSEGEVARFSIPAEPDGDDVSDESLAEDVTEGISDETGGGTLKEESVVGIGTDVMIGVVSDGKGSEDTPIVSGVLDEFKEIPEGTSVATLEVKDDSAETVGAKVVRGMVSDDNESEGEAVVSVPGKVNEENPDEKAVGTSRDAVELLIPWLSSRMFQSWP